MGGREKHHHHHLHLISHAKKVDVPPKGCMAIRVGREEPPQRFVVPVVYLNHPLFIRLLKEAEEEYGFDHKGAITIPCHVEYFRQVQGLIDRENSVGGGGGGGDHQYSLHFHPLSRCFKA